MAAFAREATAPGHHPRRASSHPDPDEGASEQVANAQRAGAARLGTWHDQPTFCYLRHVLNLAIKDRLLDRNPVSGVKFLTEATTTRFLSDTELESLRGIMASEH